MSKGAVRLRPASRPNRVIIAVGVVLLVLAFIVFIVGIVLLQKKICPRDASASSLTQENLSPKCRYSEEAKRVGLPSFLEKVKNSYFKYNPDQIMWDPDVRVSGKKLTEAKFSKYLPYNPEPMQLKYKTDTSRYLLKEIMNKEIDEDKLKPRESKALAQVKHYLQHTFGAPFDENYYAGDWMMGPNFFCWQPICNVPRAIDGFALNLFPKTFADVRKIYYTLQAHKKTFKQYRKNLELGVKTGMVRALEDCKSGLNAFKEKYPQIAISDKPSGVFQEWYTNRYRSPYFLRSLNKEVEGQWKAFSNGKTVNQSLFIALEKGIGEPVLELIQYLEHEHMRHCLPSNVSSGLANLPVDYVYTDLVADKSVNTTKALPTGERLNGPDTYKMILSYFTTFNITPEEIYNKGQEQVYLFLPKAIEIAKNVTGESDYIMAVLLFVQRLNSYDQWHNADIFPANESNQHAHKICSSSEQAQKHCPRRWAALQEWSKYIMGVMGMILPKITPFFYFSGRKITAANCPVATQPHFNPSQGTMFFKPSDSKCSKPSYFVLPFFLGDYGPKYQEWSVIGHEARPGHHTQMQGLQEHFRDKCGGVIKWLDKGTSYIAFQEGWALYAENPVLSDDVKLYKENILQRYGMYKWQVWRAVRLIVDTGLHYRGMEREEALAEFEEKTWDQSDFADKEITRYMSVPGQATAYMLGRLELINMRKKAEKELGKRFNIRDFHYQVLSQGSAPITFLRGHIDRYVRCVKGELKGEVCDLILMRSEEDEGEKEQEEDEEDEDEEGDKETEYDRAPAPF